MTVPQNERSKTYTPIPLARYPEFFDMALARHGSKADDRHLHPSFVSLIYITDQ